MSDAPIITGPESLGILIPQDDNFVTLKVPGTDYQIKLVPTGDIPDTGSEVINGIIRADALRIDVITAGGKYIEPVSGRPRRIQGRITGGDIASNTLIVNAGGAVIHAKLMDLQKASDFMIGQNVSFDVKAGATFELSK
ncbi:hypothetical protein KS4_31660 [Poriferisphaera corsica]|uniref:Uncharacterized protein n=1 Tax=Poriferisphaera corsica TaxID=2528020 RepID=A0A517YXY8_9BACT|nr:hypothetical protein [Poriferisphaera corsica]QDU35088.1 hypothetical protein KS4_31660 [Poriferisphaera corsica]